MRETMPSSVAPSDGGPFGAGPANQSLRDWSGSGRKGPGSPSRGAWSKIRAQVGSWRHMRVALLIHQLGRLRPP